MSETSVTASGPVSSLYPSAASRLVSSGSALCDSAAGEDVSLSEFAMPTDFGNENPAPPDCRVMTNAVTPLRSRTTTILLINFLVRRERRYALVPGAYPSRCCTVLNMDIVDSGLTLLATLNPPRKIKLPLKGKWYWHLHPGCAPPHTHIGTA